MSSTSGSNPQRVGVNTNIKQFNDNQQSGIQWYFKYGNVVPQKIKNQVANVGIEGNLTVDGCINGTLCTPSDSKLKENVILLKDISECDHVLNLNPVQYNYIHDERKKQHYGLIAQDVENIFPDLIKETYDTTHKTNIKSVNYVELIPILIHKMKQMQTEINNLKLENSKNKKYNKTFEQFS